VAYPESVDISGGRLERWAADRHTDGLVAACADPEVMRFLGGPMPRAVTAEMSARIAEHWEVFGFGLWAVVAADGGVAGFAGACRALWHPEHRADTEVGWRLARWAWGRGFATGGGLEGAKAAFRELGLPEVVAFVHPENERSVAVVARLGMEFTRMTDDKTLQHPLRMYRLLPESLGETQ
jgi:RimJ/RimL family protein N-acetyltransferase